jgi:hypothetical protein
VVLLLFESAHLVFKLYDALLKGSIQKIKNKFALGPPGVQPFYLQPHNSPGDMLNYVPTRATRT